MLHRNDLGLDYETFSDVDLRRHGLDRYIDTPGFAPLLVCAIRNHSRAGYTFDFVMEPETAQLEYELFLQEEINNTIYAHNAGFERAVTKWITDHWLPEERTVDVTPSFIDTAVLSRTQGAAGALAGAARQLTPISKLESGAALIQIFCVPNEWNGGKAPTRELILSTPGMLEKWEQFVEYCHVDAEAGLLIALNPFNAYLHTSLQNEVEYEYLTAGMNKVGWNVDLPLVLEMKERYERNLDKLIADFHALYDPKFELNLNSPIQLKKWCGERGIKAKSFDKDNVQSLERKLREKLAILDPTHPRHQDYSQVHAMLVTKQEMGGSSLKKLQVIIDQAGNDGRLRDQYVHCGAGQTFRTSGRGVQMQNLKRLDGDLFDMDSLHDPFTEADNNLLAANLRQVFTSSHKDGELVVGDFSSVESRGLAWLAGAQWKIDAFHQGKDMYRVLAAKIYGLTYEQVHKDSEERRMGKVGELSCGYGAGGGSVSSFAQGMGIEMTEEEGNVTVRDWRGINVEVVDMWANIDTGLWSAVESGTASYMALANGLELSFTPVPAPDSLRVQHPGVNSLIMRLKHVDEGNIETVVVERVFHGVYARGNRIVYYKPSERIHGNAWTDEYVDPKTKQVVNFSIYGGKITGILTQSMCREMFFYSMAEMEKSLRFYSNAPMVGQFHDEIVVDWTPEGSLAFQPAQAYDQQISLEGLLAIMEKDMSTPPPWAKGFPLGADIKHAFRYIK